MGISTPQPDPLLFCEDARPRMPLRSHHRPAPLPARKRRHAMRMILSVLALAARLDAATAQPPPATDARPPQPAFVNGALAVPGAPANTDTIPAKFSEKNAADDR